MKLRYRGGFYSVNNTLYDIEIWQDGYEGNISDIAFCGAPLDIEWGSTDKLEPVQSSHATLQLYSDTDRQFVDLYTIEVGSIRMDVYRDKKLYWSGTLDPELYEEPYAYKEGYGVTVTFSDMAILDRINWNASGFMTIRGIVEKALRSSGINYLSLVEHSSTFAQYSSEPVTTYVTLNCGNFYDEDGEPMTLREVLDETLRPFSLRLIQKDGKIFVYDLNAVYSELPAEIVDWQKDDAVLGVDKVYNNVTVKFSPYYQNQLLDEGVDVESVTAGSELKVKVNPGDSADGFKIRLSDTGKGLEKSDGKYFAISPVFSGSEEAGIAWTVKIDYTGESGSNYRSYINEASDRIGNGLLKASKKPYLAYTSYLRSDYKLRIKLDLMADVKYNPYESDSEGGDQQRLKDWCNFSYVPFLLTLRDENGNALYHYENKGVKDSKSYNNMNARWIAGEGKWGDAFLAYYDLNNRKSETGLGNWKTNKQCIGYFRDGLPQIFHKRGDGEFIDLPITGGWLELQIGNGLLTYDYESKSEWQTQTDIYWRIRWLLYKNLNITLVDKNYQTIKEKDVEHHAWINRSAKEELKIDTIIGCLDQPSPTAIGQVFRESDKSLQQKFTRAGVTDCLERLLIGTVYSNYATRHDTLSGTTALLSSFGIYGDINDPGKNADGDTQRKYILLSEIQHLQYDESEIVMAQFEADNYKGVEFDG